eukprot:15788638-Heterocapsa_arctica.AAC.1
MDDLSLRCDCSDLYIFTARSPMLPLALCTRGDLCKTHLMKTGSTQFHQSLREAPRLRKMLLCGQA